MKKWKSDFVKKTLTFSKMHFPPSLSLSLSGKEDVNIRSYQLY